MRSTTRKLQQVGGGTYTVSVPKDWATERGLTAGTSVRLFRHVDGSLVVRGSESEPSILEHYRTELDDPTVDELERTLRIVHKIGFERVTIATTDEFTAEHRRAVASTTRPLVGFEVVEESDSAVTLQNVVDATNVSIRQSLTQLQYVAVSMLQGGVDAFLVGDERADGQLADREDEVDRLFGVVERHFNRSLVSFEELSDLDVRRAVLFDYYEVATHLECVGVEATRLASLNRRTANEPPADYASDLSAVAERAGEAVENATSSLLATPGPSAERADETLASIPAIHEEIETIQDSLFADTSPDAAVVATALTSVARTADHASAIAEIALQASHRPDAD